MDTKLNLKGRKLRIASLKSFPFQDVRKTDDYHYTGEGFSFEIVKQLSQHFNFTYDIVVPDDLDFGVLINGTRWTGLIGMLLNNKADMVASPLSITQERQNAVTFSSSLYKDSLGLMFTRPKTQHNNEALLAPFTNTVWISVAVIAVAMCLVLYTLIYSSKCLLSKKVRRPFMKDTWTLNDCAWFVYSSLMKQGFNKTTDFNPVRILMAAWWITCLLLGAFYTANLTAFMTTETSVTDRSIEELIRSGRKWIFRKGTAFSDYLFKESIAEHENDFSLLKKSFMRGNGMMIDSDDEVIDFIKKGYAYIQEMNVLNYMIFENSMETNGSCAFNAINLHFFEHTTAFAFPKGSRYASPFSEYIEFLRKTGLVQKWMQQYLLSADVEI
ncbi:Glutamate receptor ionotropic like protein [Argiope bruennichi]|uniref:Glutamate receptor ionotropic like protein n=1 Tax=Argiope bruennichi TaxID=94029 RepID=A0A8T0FGG9_ARGBR|nr:Glutamate receptor ionotropic like protein [Argiope bruennichi]